MKPIYSFQSVSELLWHEFERRQRRNPRYSQRGFARDLQLPPSLLCEVLANKSRIAPARVSGVSNGLRLTPMESAFLEDLVCSEAARSRAHWERAMKRLERYRKDPPLLSLADDQFRTIAEWYHLALVDFLQLPGRDHGRREIAQALGIELHEVVDALERLERLGMIAREGKRYVVQAKRSFFASSVPSRAVRDFHRGVLGRASAAIESQGMEERELSSSYFLVSKDDIVASKTELREFRDGFLRNRRNEASKADFVYCLSMQLFRIAR